MFNGTPFWGATDPDRRLKGAIAEYRAAYARAGTAPTPNDDYGWDPAKITVAAFRAIGTGASAAQIHDYIENLHDFPVPAGSTTSQRRSARGLGDDATVICSGIRRR